MGITIKQLLTSNQNWWEYHQQHKETLRPVEIEAVTKLLSCKNIIRGYHEYHCSSPNCSHIKYVYHTCKSRLCSSCGKKLTAAWLNKQRQTLPNTPWQHITFTMPDYLWPFFLLDRTLLNEIGILAANIIKSIGKKKHALPAIFIAIHTFGHDLKWNVHLHLSTTTGGLSDDHTHWVKLFYHAGALRNCWRYDIISLFRQRLKEGSLAMPEGLSTLDVKRKLSDLYNINWQVHCADVDNDYQRALAYLSRYVKRPPIAETKLRHYDGTQVAFDYIDRHDNTTARATFDIDGFITRLLRHIPEPNFRMIRYYGILSNRLRGTLLPIVHDLLGKPNAANDTAYSYQELMQAEFGQNPMRCILCNAPLQLVAVKFGKTSLAELLPLHRQLAQLKKCA